MIPKLKKCFLDYAIGYPRHVIAPGWSHIATKTIDAERYLKRLTITSELRLFLGLCNVYRRFVPNFFLANGRPLYKELKKGEYTTFELNDKKRQTADDLKQKLTTPPILVLPRTKI